MRTNKDKDIIGVIAGKYRNGTDSYLVKVPKGFGWYLSLDGVHDYELMVGSLLDVGYYWNEGGRGLTYLGRVDAAGKRPKRHIVIEIADDGAEAKYIVGKKVEKTASVKRYKDDNPDDRMAAHYVVEKLFGKDCAVTNINVDELDRAVANVEIASDHINNAKKILRREIYGIKE